MQFKYTDGFELADFAAPVSTAVDYTLKAEEKRPFIAIVATAASKTVTLDLADGDVAIVSNVGASNAFTLKNVAGDTGTSVAAGKVAFVFASTTADASKVYILN